MEKRASQSLNSYTGEGDFDEQVIVRGGLGWLLIPAATSGKQYSAEAHAAALRKEPLKLIWWHNLWSTLC